MAKQSINIGITPNDGTGDPLRNAFDKVNDNFDEVYGDGFVEEARIAAGAVTISKIADAAKVTEAEGISSNDNDTTLPTSAAVKDYVDTEIAGLIDAAPAALDTLNELAAALGDDANFASTVTASIATKADQTDLDTHEADTANPHSVTKAQVGLSNVDNTSDANKPVSTATQTALDAKQDTLTAGDVTLSLIDPTAIVTEAEGIASNDNDTTIPTSAAVVDYVASQAGTNTTYTISTATDTFAKQKIVLTGSDSSTDEVILEAGSHIQLSNLNGNILITNTNPGSGLNLSGGTGISVGGAYPNLSVTNTAPDQTVSLTQGSNISITGTYPNFTIAASNLVTDSSGQALAAATSLTFANNILTLTKGDGSTDTVNLSAYLDEDARAIASGALNASTGIVTFTRDDSTTFTLDLSALLDDTNLVTSVNGATGVVVLNTDNIAQGSTNLYDKTVTLTQGSNVTITGTYPNFTISSTDTNTQLSTEQVQDIVGAMVSGNTESNITVTYNDTTGKLDFTANAGDITGVTAGSGLSGGGTSGTVTLNHADTSSAANLTASGRTYVTGLTFDTYGHVTGYTTGTETVTDTNTTYSPGAGLDLNGTVFSVESDLRGDVFHIGRDANDYYTVGTTVHDWRLDGNLDMRLENDGDLHVDGDVIAYSTTTSDKRLKDNIKTIDSALEKVEKLRGVEYDWNATSRKGQHDMGVIAQEIEEVFPFLVREKELQTGEFADNPQTFKTVDYEKLVGVLIESIKELSAEVKELKSKI